MRLRTILARSLERPFRLGLLARFSVLSAAAMLLLGFVLARTLGDQICHRAIKNAEQASELVTRFGIQPQLGDVDLDQPLSAEAVSALDNQLRPGYTSKPVATTILVWNRRQIVEYSNDRRLIGTAPEPADRARVAKALAGRTNSEVEHELIESYVPLDSNGDGRAEGAFEIFLHYKPVADAIARDQHRLYLIIFGGLLVLYAALFRIVATASGRLRRQAAANEYQARHDVLTGLPNRNTFYEAVGEAIALGAGTGRRAAVMVIDLDRFKEVNDTLGHHIGDLLLREAGERIAATLRNTDALARLGGDEFAVLLREVGSPETAIEVAGRIGEALERPFSIEGLTVHVEASTGIALSPEHGTDVSELLQHADVAMYAAKGSPARCEVYSPDQGGHTPGRLAMLGQLRRAIDNREFVLYYQPKADIRTGRVEGAEALVRWIHPEHGLIPPNEFIPLAEHTGLIKPLTAFVLDTALAQCREWVDQGLDLTVAVNLSVRNLLDSGLPDAVAAMLERHGVEARRLKLEITEGTIMADPDRAMEVLLRLHGMGIALSIDDFGTGYSSLAYLKDLPVSELKIDRTFVNDMSEEDSDAFIVRSTIDLARNLGLQVVAEGVETEAIWTQLGDLGCDIGQGFYLSRPVPPDEFVSWLTEARSREKDLPWTPSNFAEPDREETE